MKQYVCTRCGTVEQASAADTDDLPAAFMTDGGHVFAEPDSDTDAQVGIFELIVADDPRDAPRDADCPEAGPEQTPREQPNKRNP